MVRFDDRRSLRLGSLVGVLQTPCGTRIEILPKSFDGTESVHSGRRLLRKLICAALDIPNREVGPADLQSFDAPMSEWVIERFLAEVNHLVKRGVRLDYLRVQASEPFLRGQFDVARQIRKPIGRAHEFEIRHDVFALDRPENRLLRSALDHVAAATQSSLNWRLAQELRLLFREVPQSKNASADFRAWSHDRLMAHYRAVRPWCELVLSRRMPLALVGDWHGVSLLFPMEKLFERFVAGWLERHVAQNVRVRAQAASEYLCVHMGDPMFRLEPDIVLEGPTRRWVLDTKWKRLDSGDRANNYGLGQGDIYQLFAYGMKYLGTGGGDLVLIYPAASAFREALPHFDLGHHLRLHVLPFDLDGEDLLGGQMAGLPTMQAGMDWAA